MNNGSRPKPLLIYDGDCEFCRWWIERWKRMTGDVVDYAPYQEVVEEYPNISLQEFKRSLQLVHQDGSVSSGARAVFESLEKVPAKKWILWSYRHVPGFRVLSELSYQFIASYRNGLYKLTRFLSGSSLFVVLGLSSTRSNFI